FADVDDFGFDPDLGGPIYARNDVVDIAFAAGADEPYARVFSLRIDNAETGLATTEGDPIHLYEEGGLIVGRVGGPDGVAAFALAIDGQGRVSIAQYLSLKHLDGTDPNDPIDLAGKVSAVLETTDADGDTTQTDIAIGGQIQFRDDGPTFTGETSSVDVDENDLDNADPDAGDFGFFDIIEGSAGSSPNPGDGTDNTDYTQTYGGIFGGLLNTLLNGSTFASGSLANTVNFGADGPGGFLLKDEAVDGLGSLTSNGDPVAYTSIQAASGGFQGSLVLGYVSNVPDHLIDGLLGLVGSFISGAPEDELQAQFVAWLGQLSQAQLDGSLPDQPTFRLVFALGTLHDSGAYQFRLFDQLDHAPSDDPSTANVNEDDELVIDFSSIFAVVDGDGDEVDLPQGTLTVNV